MAECSTVLHITENGKLAIIFSKKLSRDFNNAVECESLLELKKNVE